MVFDELEKHKPEILAKSGLSEHDLNLFLSLISAKIEFVPYPEVERFIPEAEIITPDPDDTEYFALALKLNCAIWTNDKKLKQQEKVKIFSTGDLIKEIK